MLQMSEATQTKSRPMHSHTAFRRDILAVVYDLDAPNGMDIKAELEADYETENLTTGRIYPNLDQLVDGGLLDKRSVDERTNAYHVTRRGEHALQTHLDWVTRRTEGLRDE
jgi:PadR family transcriptional regulator PadR